MFLRVQQDCEAPQFRSSDDRALSVLAQSSYIRVHVRGRSAHGNVTQAPRPKSRAGLGELLRGGQQSRGEA